MIKAVEVCMGGSNAIRGFVIQTMAILLDATQPADTSWTSLELEPDWLNEKVDFLWTFSSKRKAVQVKSSINLISATAARKWADAFERSLNADEYELQLFGPSDSRIPHAIGKVAIPPPRPLDLEQTLDVIAHRVDRFTSSLSEPALDPHMREVLAQALCNELMKMSAGSRRLTHFELIALLRQWIWKVAPNVAPPAAIRVMNNCHLTVRARLISGPQALALAGGKSDIAADTIAGTTTDAVRATSGTHHVTANEILSKPK
jgi:hypothetical protein